MIRNPAISVVAVVAALAIAPPLDRDEIDAATAAASAPPTPTFRISWRRDTLTIAGHTMSLGHERALLQAVEASYPGIAVSTDFSPLGIAPDYWPAVTVDALHVIADTVSSEAEIKTGRLSVRAITTSAAVWRKRMHTLRESLPEDVVLSVDTIAVDAAVDVADACETAFDAFDAGPINFMEATTELRSSAFPRLDRVIALASACDRATITITGHTDASGPEPWNRRLSLARAAAVADYLELGGIPRSRLLPVGRGSAAPVADNASRYGRGQNRRIEIEWSNGPEPE